MCNILYHTRTSRTVTSEVNWRNPERFQRFRIDYPGERSFEVLQNCEAVNCSRSRGWPIRGHFGLAVIRLKPRSVLNRTKNMAGGEAILERLTHPEVADFLIRGARFIKWDEVCWRVSYSISVWTCCIESRYICTARSISTFNGNRGLLTS